MTAPRPASSCWRAARSDSVPEYFKLQSFRVIDERRWNARGELVTLSEATIKVEVGGERFDDGGGGQRPGQRARHRARARRSDIPSTPRSRGPAHDYKVRILTGGTEAVTRVMVESADGQARAGRRSASRPTSSTPRSTRWRIRSATSSIATARGRSACVTMGQATPAKRRAFFMLASPMRCGA